MLVEQLQNQLQTLYAVDCQYRVADFMIQDPSLVGLLDTSSNARELAEKLLILQQEDSVDVALYLDPQLIEHLTEHDPLQQLNDDNIHDFWLVVEGVSHFVYFTWSTHYDRAVSLLEMELQAEVDKFMLTVQLLRQQLNQFHLGTLHDGLFERVRFDPQLNQEEKTRYQDANYFAAKFCAYISRRYAKAHQQPQLMRELRYFYRLNHHYKFQNISRLRYQ